MMNNNLNITGKLTGAQLISLLVVNIIGIVLLWLTIYVINKKTPDLKTNLFSSIKMGLGSLIIFAMLAVDICIIFWIQSGNTRSLILAIPLLICGGIFFLPVVIAGTYVQLKYAEKIQEYVNKHK